jgi:hypothetical protein
MDMNRWGRRVDVFLEEVALDGFDPGGAEAFAEDIRISVQRVLATRVRKDTPPRTERRGPEVDVPAATRSATLGRAVGEEVGAAIIGRLEP